MTAGNFPIGIEFLLSYLIAGFSFGLLLGCSFGDKSFTKTHTKWVLIFSTTFVS